MKTMANLKSRLCFIIFLYLSLNCILLVIALLLFLTVQDLKFHYVSFSASISSVRLYLKLMFAESFSITIYNAGLAIIISLNIFRIVRRNVREQRDSTCN